MRAFDNAYLIDGSPLPAPDAGVEMTFEDLEASDSGLDEAGFFHRAVLRENVRSWDFSYAVLTAQEYGYILGLFAGKPTFAFTFPLPEGSQTVEACCRKGSIALYDRSAGLYKNLKFTLREC